MFSEYSLLDFNSNLVFQRKIYRYYSVQSAYFILKIDRDTFFARVMDWYAWRNPRNEISWHGLKYNRNRRALPPGLGSSAWEIANQSTWTKNFRSRQTSAPFPFCNTAELSHLARLFFPPLVFGKKYTGSASIGGVFVGFLKLWREIEIPIKAWGFICFSSDLAD